MDKLQTWILSEMSQTFKLDLVEWSNPGFNLNETMHKNVERSAENQKEKGTKYMALNLGNLY